MLTNFNKKMFWLRSTSFSAVSQHKLDNRRMLVLNNLYVKFFSSERLLKCFTNTGNYSIFFSIFSDDAFFTLKKINELSLNLEILLFKFSDLRLLLDTTVACKYKPLVRFFDDTKLFCLTVGDFTTYLMVLRKLFELEVNDLNALNVLLTRERDCFVSFCSLSAYKDGVRALYSLSSISREQVLVEFYALLNLSVGNFSNLLFKSYSSDLSIFASGLGYAIFFR